MLNSSALRTASAAALLGAGLTMAVGAAPASAQDPAATMVVDGTVAKDGKLTISETLTFPQGAPDQVVQHLATTRDGLDRTYYRYQVSDVRVASGDAGLTTSSDDDDVVLTLDTSRAGSKPVTVTYTVAGAARAAGGTDDQARRTEVTWPVLQGLSVAVEKVSGTISTPGTITHVNCQSGPVGVLTPCSTFAGGTHDAPQPTFTDGPRAAGDVVELEFGLPSAVVAPDAVIEHRWSLDRAFSVTPATLLASLLPLLLGGALLWWLHRRGGRDQLAADRVTPVAEFTPVAAGQSRFTVLENVRPGHVGTVADEKVDPVDVTATLLDLAVRGWLRIVELPRERDHAPLDWRFDRVEGGEGTLAPFETTLRDAVAPAGQGCRVSEIGASVAPVVERVQDELYDDVVRHGWFDHSPHQTRSRWATLGWVALGLAMLVTVALVAFTSFGLLGVALTLLALGALFVGQEMPRRTSAGTALLGGLHSLASQLRSQPTTQFPPGEQYAELSRILPYAVVLGGRQRWLEALVAADDDETPDGEDLTWYHAPADWHLRDLPGSLDAFVVTVQGQLYDR